MKSIPTVSSSFDFLLHHVALFFQKTKVYNLGGWLQTLGIIIIVSSIDKMIYKRFTLSEFILVLFSVNIFNFNP